MLTVHHLENSRSQRILWLLEELGVDYTVQRYERDKETSKAPAELRQLHPLGKAPIVTDGDTTLAESGAIIEYLVENYGSDAGLRPTQGSPQRLQYNYWLHYAEGTFMPLMIVSLLMNRIETAKLPFFVKPVARGIVAKVYTSSNGTRTDKGSIVEGMRGAPPSDPDNPAVVYTAEDVDIRMYGDMAVVAFRLVGTAQDDEGAVSEYFNTGTFQKRDGRWLAVAWQATRIPAASD